MKAKLIFDTTDPDEKQEFIRCTKALNMAMALWDIIELKKKIEHRFEVQHNTNNDVFDGIDAMSEGISSILEENNINIDELLL